MFICWQKLNSILHAFLKTDCQSFTKYGIGGEISTKVLAFILNYFQEKLITKFFKTPKKVTLGPVWTRFAQIWTKMNFRSKEGSVRS